MHYRFLLLLLISFKSFAQPKTDAHLKEILFSNNDSIMQLVLQHPETYRLQIIYTQIDRDKNDRPSFTNYYFHFDSTLYFNPASTVKLPLALLALEKLNNMHIKGVNKFTPMQFDSSYEGQTTEYIDSTSKNNLPSIAHFIKKAFLVSDNDAYNRLYQFVGQQAINQNLHAKGYKDVRITREFMGFTPEQNRHTNQIRFITEDGKNIYVQPPAYNPDSFYYPRQVMLGKAHFDRNDSLINEPFDFTSHNNISLLDLQQILQSVLFPKSVPSYQRFHLTKEDYQFVYQYLSQFPSETNYPKYDDSEYYDSYVKFFFRNPSHKMPPNVRVFNKVGWAYGFLTDVSYVADFGNKIEYMLSATLYVNSDDVVNDNNYDYENVGWPFLYQLGQTIYNYELKRKRTNIPDLSKFKMKYEQRDKRDTRPTIKEVDN